MRSVSTPCVLTPKKEPVITPKKEEDVKPKTIKHEAVIGAGGVKSVKAKGKDTVVVKKEEPVKVNVGCGGDSSGSFNILYLSTLLSSSAKLEEERKMEKKNCCYGRSCYVSAPSATMPKKEPVVLVTPKNDVKKEADVDQYGTGTGTGTGTGVVKSPKTEVKENVTVKEEEPVIVKLNVGCGGGGGGV
ncbi:hypothetical protein F0562_029243 [Nyssa sinensis]|uniref:Uncharacterized protein n=1 Tax=Nyssa sinensis TaxID=561372 RepID=A0A5J5B0I9_9ASTE|nr:hypothetical protein F0562_029243 [Nyssa sinensis]